MPKITALTALTDPISTDILPIVDDPGGSPVTKKITLSVLGRGMYVALDTPLTSTSWDGDAYSTTAKTVIDLSAVFAVPAGVYAVDVGVVIRDSASAAGDYWICLGPTNAAGVGRRVRCSGLPNDSYTNGNFMVKCDASGDIFYQVAASGVGTMDITIQIHGYWV